MNMSKWSDGEVRAELRKVEQDAGARGVSFSDWEIQFVEDVAYGSGDLSARQRKKAIELIERYRNP